MKWDFPSELQYIIEILLLLINGMKNALSLRSEIYSAVQAKQKVTTAEVQYFLNLLEYS